MANCKWLKGNGGTEFLQFSHRRITRSEFPLGGYVYTVTESDDSGKQHYSGSSFEKAFEIASAGAA